MKKLFIFLGVTLMGSLEKTGVCSSGKNTDDVNPPPEKLCVLTFDDGPNPDPELMPLVLDKLKAYKVAATFFLIQRSKTCMYVSGNRRRRHVLK